MIAKNMLQECYDKIPQSKIKYESFLDYLINVINFIYSIVSIIKIYMH